MDKLEAYNELYEKIVQGENEVYVPDGTILSLAVYNRIDHKCVDSYFLRATDFEVFSEPYARIYMEIDSSKLVLYENMELSPSAKDIKIAGNLYNEEEYAAYAGGYMNIREFVFKTNLSGEQKDALQSYLEIFRKVIRKQHETCYLEMAEEFLGWTEMML